jgi:hypothetical protein
MGRCSYRTRNLKPPLSAHAYALHLNFHLGEFGRQARSLLAPQVRALAFEKEVDYFAPAY